MRYRSLVGVLLVSCAVDYRADEAEYQCLEYGNCLDGGSDSSIGSGGVGSGSGGGDGDASTGGTVENDAGTGGSSGSDADSDAGPLCVNEVCNGLDDDCDGRKDVDDGVPLGGSVEVFADVGDDRAPIIWVESLGAYAVAWTDRSSGSRHLHLAILDEDGNRIDDADLTAPGEEDTARDIVFGPGDFRILSTALNGSVIELHYRQVFYDPTAAVDAGSAFVSSPRVHVNDVQEFTHPTMVSIGDYGVVATWMVFDQAAGFDTTLYVQAIAPAGWMPGPPDLLPLNARVEREVSSEIIDGVGAFVWVECPLAGSPADAGVDAGAGSGCKVSLSRVDYNPEPAVGHPAVYMNAPGTSPLAASVAGNGTEFMIAWTENNVDSDEWSLNYSVMSPNGEILCGPKTYMTRPSLEGPGFYFALTAQPDLAPLPDGSFAVLVEYDEDGGTLFLGTLDTSCTATEGTPVIVNSTGHAFVNEPRIAASDSSVVTLWVDRFLPDSTLFTRKLSPLLCGAP